MPTQPTQVRRPWRATIRTVFQALIGVAAVWAIVVEAAGLDPSWPWVAVSLTVTAAITRVMALPQVEALIERFLPILAAEPTVQAGPRHAAQSKGDVYDDLGVDNDAGHSVIWIIGVIVVVVFVLALLGAIR